MVVVGKQATMKTDCGFSSRHMPISHVWTLDQVWTSERGSITAEKTNYVYNVRVHSRVIQKKMYSDFCMTPDRDHFIMNTNRSQGLTEGLPGRYALSRAAVLLLPQKSVTARDLIRGEAHGSILALDLAVYKYKDHKDFVCFERVRREMEFGRFRFAKQVRA